MKMSSRIESLREDDLEHRIEHNLRIAFARSFNSTFSYLNKIFVGGEFNESSIAVLNNAKLWQKVEEDFRWKKANSFTLGRFKKRRTPKRVKIDKNNFEYQTIETHIVKELIIQIGDMLQHDLLSRHNLYKIYQQILEKILEETGFTLLLATLHCDETTPHLHIIATAYNFKSGLFSNYFKEKNSYSKLRNFVHMYISNNIVPLKPIAEEGPSQEHLQPANWNLIVESLLPYDKKYLNSLNYKYAQLTVYKNTLKKQIQDFNRVFNTLSNTKEDNDTNLINFSCYKYS